VAGGYIILNYWLYREKDHTAKFRSKRYRDKKKPKRSKRSGPLNGEVEAIQALEDGRITQEQADARAALTREG